MLKELLIENIKKARKEKELKQSEMAELLGVHLNAYSQWERGIRGIGFETIEQIAKITDKDPLWFFSPSDSPDTPITHSTDLQQEILENINKIISNTEKLIKRLTISQILEENGSNNNFSTGNSHTTITGELPNNVIPFPQNKTIPKFAQPIGAGYTLNGYHPDDVEGFFEMPVTRETRHIEAIAPVSGNSMYPEIHDGALVFIRPAKDFKDGDKLIVFLKESGELTLKYAFKVPPPKNSPQPHRGWISLQGFSDDTKKIYEYRDVEIQGIVVDWVNDRKTVNDLIEKLKSVPQE